MIKTEKTRENVERDIQNMDAEANAHLVIFKANLKLSELPHNAPLAEVYRSAANAEHALYHQSLQSIQVMRDHLRILK